MSSYGLEILWLPGCCSVVARVLVVVAKVLLCVCYGTLGGY